MRPAPWKPEPLVMVSPEIIALTLASILNTRLALLPLTVTPAAGPVIVSLPLVLLSSSWAPLRMIVRGVAKTVGSKVIWMSLGAAFAMLIAWRRSISLAIWVSVGLLTMMGAGHQRSSSAWRAGLTRWGALRIVRVTGRLNQF